REMLNYTHHRLTLAIATLMVIDTAAYFLMRAAPGGPFNAEDDLEPEVLENIRAAYDLDKPLLTQFWIFVKNAVRGDFGPSIVYKDFSVTELIAVGLPVSVKLGFSALLVALLIGGLGGIIAALRQNSLV